MNSEADGTEYTILLGCKSSDEQNSNWMQNFWSSDKKYQVEDMLKLQI